MKRTERINQLQQAIQAALTGRQVGIWTALPGTVVSYDSARMTLVVQPTIQAQVMAQDGTLSWVTLPQLLDVPICFPNGGGFMMTFPIEVDDEVLVVFSSRCIDNWWYQGGVQTQAELRLHDLSDGFAIIGPRSLPRVLTGISTDSVQLRTDAGTTFIELKEGQINIVGNVHVVGSIEATDEIFVGDIELTQHEHPNIGDPGGDPFVDKPIPPS